MCPALWAVGQVADFSFRVLGAAALAMNRKLSLPVSSMTVAKQASASAERLASAMSDMLASLPIATFRKPITLQIIMFCDCPKAEFNQTPTA